MAATTTNSKNVERKVLLKPRSNGTRGSELMDIREIVSNKSGSTNYVLVFKDAEVVMPGTWSIRADQFPDGLYVGQKLAAYWEVDESGNNRFHLYEV